MFKLSNGDDKKFLDGGFYDNLPVNMVYKRGYKDIITVEMKSLGLKKSLRAKDANIISIVPSGDVGTTLEFNQERSRNNMRMGYFDAMKAFGKYEGFDYFLEEVPEEDYFLNILLELDETQIAEMGREIGLTSGSSKRLLLERIIPEFARLFNLDQNASYKDIVVRFVELLAAAANIERLQSYTFRELRKEVFNIIENEQPGSLDFSKLPDFLKKSLLIKHSFKKNLVVNWAKIIVDRE
jgi:NTE family protein